MKCLVTGGAGFLGSHIAEQLRQSGADVVIFCRGHHQALRDRGFAVFAGDLSDTESVEAACRGIDAVFHAGAKTGFWGERRAFYEANVLGTENIIRGCRANRVRRLIYTSSPSVVFDGRDHKGEDESIPYPRRYENPYGETKALAERAVMAANCRSLNTICLRPHAVWGPGDRHLLPTIIEAGRAGRLPQIGDGENQVDFTYVEDAAQAHLVADQALARRPGLGGSVYFISQDEPVLLWRFIREIFAALDIPPPRRTISVRSGRRIGMALELAHRLLRLAGQPMLTRTLVSEAGLHHYYDISRAKRDLGYRPRHTMAEAMAKTLPHLKNGLRT